MEKMTLVTLKQLFPNDNIHDAIEHAWFHGLISHKNYLELKEEAEFQFLAFSLFPESSLLLGH